MDKVLLAKRRKIKSIKNIKNSNEYKQYRDFRNLTDEQKLLLDSVFLKRYDYSYIADCILYCSISAVKKKMRELYIKL